MIEADEVIRSALHFILDDHSETHSFATLDLAYAGAGDVTPIMIVANSGDEPLALKALEWGAHNVLGKPISFDSVHRRVDGLLRRQRVSPVMLGLLPPSAAW